MGKGWLKQSQGSKKNTKSLVEMMCHGHEFVMFRIQVKICFVVF